MKHRLSAHRSVLQTVFRAIAKVFAGVRRTGPMAALCLSVSGLGVLCSEANAQSGPSVSSGYQELHLRAVANATNFYLYQDQDSGLNHGFPSGFFGTTSTLTIDTGCIDNPADTVTGCYPSSNTTALDLTRGTVFRVTFAPLSGDQFAGVNIEEPLNWGANGQPASNGYNLTGATAVSLDVRSPGGISVQFGVNSCVTNFIQLPASATYTTMTFTLDTTSLSCTPDLTAVHLLFTVTTNASEAGAGGTVLMDNIRFTPVPLRAAPDSETLSLPLSTQTFGVVPQTQAPFPPDQVNRNVATVYEAALSLLGFLARGTPQDLPDAQSIANALDYALHNDNQGDPIPVAPGGYAGLHNAYSSGDIALLNGQSTGAAAANVRLAGFTCGSTSPTGFCLVLDGATGGNNAFAILSLVAAYRQFGNVTYLNDALEIANWIVGNLLDQTGSGYGGYYYGYPDMGLAKVLEKNKSTENNADIFAAFSALATVESQLGSTSAASTWTTNAQIAGNFVMAMYDSADGRFYNGTVPVGTAPGAGVCPTGPQNGNDVISVCDLLDSNTFTTLAMAGSATYKSSIDWTKPISHVSTVYPQTISANGLSFQGVDIILPPPTGVAWEFTGQFVETCQYVAALLATSTCGTLAQTDLTQIGQAQTSAPFADGMGVVAATINGENAPPGNLPPVEECLTTPFQCIPERTGLAATVWAILASENLNVFSPFPEGTGPAGMASSRLVGGNADGRLEVFVRGTDNALWHQSQLAAGGPAWSGWTSLGGILTSDAIVAQNADGRLEVFIRGNDAALWHISQTAPSASTWNPWSSLGGGLTGDMAVGRNGDGRLEVFIRGTDNGLWHNSQQAAGAPDWSGWTSLGGILTSDPVVSQNADGRLEVFIGGNDAALWHIYQTAPSATTWNPWSSLGGGLTSNPAVARNAEGRLEVFVRGNDEAVWHNSQQAAGAPDWSGWTSLGGILTSDPVVRQNTDGRLEVFIRGNDAALWHISQPAPSATTWNPWSSLGGGLAGDAAVALNADGLLEVFVHGNDNALWHNSQQAAGGPGWSGWTSLGGVIH